MRLFRWIYDLFVGARDLRCPVTGRIHDYKDGTVQEPIHFYNYSCRYCQDTFII